MLYGFLPPVTTVYIHHVQKAMVPPDQQIKISTQKTEPDLTDEQRKKVGIFLGRLEGILRITVNF